ITVNDPNAGTPPWSAGSTYAINWDFEGPELKEDLNPVKVKIEYSPTGLLVDYATIPGAASIDIGTGGTGTWVWDIGTGTTLTTVGKIKVTDTDIDSATGESLGDLEVRGNVVIDEVTTDPGNLKVLKVGDNYDIDWTIFGAIENINLFYKAGSGSWELINTGGAWTATTKPYGWSVANDIDNIVFLRIEDDANPSVFNETANTFRIIGKISLDKPSVAEPDWIVATTQNIQWTPTGTYSSVKIEGSNDDFATTWPVSTQPAGTHNQQETYEFTVTDHIGDNVKVRIFDSDSTRWDLVLDTSPGFTIKGALAITTPIVEWFVGQTNRTIQWTATGTVGNVHLEYDDGGAWHDISDPSVGVPTGGSGTGQGSYLWPAVDDAKSQSCRLRVTDLDDATDSVKDTSTTFTIWPLIDVYEPISGFNVEVQSDNTDLIKWNISGNLVSQVDIYYDTDGGANGYTNQINGAPVTASDGQYDWNSVPVTTTGNARIQVIDVDDGTELYFGESAAFDIIGKITLNQPDGNDIKINQSGADAYSIVWSAAGVPAISAYYSLSDGVPASYQFIASAAASAGNLDWDTPDAVSNSVRVKVIDSSEPIDTADVNAISPRFALVEQFSSILPANGSTLTAGSATTISWNKLGDSLADVDIYLSNNNGAVYTFIKQASNTGATAWDVPTNVRSTQCKIRVVSTENATNSANSLGVFVLKNYIDINNPTTGTLPWSVGSTYVIDWDFKGPELKEDSSPVKVKIEYSATGLGPDFAIIPGAGSIDIGTSEAGSWIWDIATNTTLSTLGKIRVTDTDIASASDTSDGNLTIRGNVVPDEISTDPGNPVILTRGQNYDVTWTVYGEIQNVNLYYKTSTGAWTTMNTSGPWDAGTQPFAWTVPDAIDSALLLKVEDNGNQSVFNETANSFKIKGNILVQAPSGGQYEVGEPIPITWVNTGTPGNVKLEYSTNAFDDENEVTDIVGSTGGGSDGQTPTYNGWSAPFTVKSNDVKVRVSTLHTDPDLVISRVSPAAFRIRPKITVVEPNEITDLWVAGSSPTIRWNPNGVMSNVIITYSVNGLGGPWTQIKDEFDQPILVPANGSPYSGWQVPDDQVLSTQTYIKITDADVGYEDVNDTSDSQFTIKGDIVMTAPAASNQIFYVDDTYVVQWSRKGVYSFVDIEYRVRDEGTGIWGSWDFIKDNATPLPNEADNIDAASGQFIWEIPDDIANEAEIKITHSGDPSVTVTNDIRIAGRITFDPLSVPALDEMWGVGETHTIRWSVSGNVNYTVRLIYFDGTQWVPIADENGLNGATGIDWNIINTVTSVARLKIFQLGSLSDATFDMSDTFSIVPNFFNTRVTDVGDIQQTEIVAGNDQDYWIRWNGDGQAAFVNLFYSTDAFASQKIPIEDTDSGDMDFDVTNDLNFLWDVPDP
ncbi:hypothetical protein ACFL5X_04135, partial [Candidatus Omnitrophota bacterium]